MIRWAALISLIVVSLFYLYLMENTQPHDISATDKIMAIPLFLVGWGILTYYLGIGFILIKTMLRAAWKADE